METKDIPFFAAFRIQAPDRAVTELPVPELPVPVWPDSGRQVHLFWTVANGRPSAVVASHWIDDWLGRHWIERIGSSTNESYGDVDDLLVLHHDRDIDSKPCSSILARPTRSGSM